MKATTEKRPMPPAAKRLLWFAGLWLAGVGVLAVIAGLLRVVIGAP